MKLKIPKKVKIGYTVFKVIPSTEGGASFSMKDSTITINVKYLKLDPGYTLNMLIHEISEICHVMCCTRYEDSSVLDNYKFFMDHKEFQNHNALLSATLMEIL